MGKGRSLLNLIARFNELNEVLSLRKYSNLEEKRIAIRQLERVKSDIHSYGTFCNIYQATLISNTVPRVKYLVNVTAEKDTEARFMLSLTFPDHSIDSVVKVEPMVLYKL